MRTIHNIQEASTMEDVARDIPKSMHHVEGKINNQHIVILIIQRKFIVTFLLSWLNDFS